MTPERKPIGRNIRPGDSSIRPSLETDPSSIGGDIGSDQIAFKPMRSSQSKKSDKMLLCDDCEVVYEDRDDWNNCPRCGNELREVEQA